MVSPEVDTSVGKSAQFGEHVTCPPIVLMRLRTLAVRQGFFACEKRRGELLCVLAETLTAAVSSKSDIPRARLEWRRRRPRRAARDFPLAAMDVSREVPFIMTPGYTYRSSALAFTASP